MKKREIDAVEAILTDPENSSRTGAEVAEAVIEALDDVRSRTHRLAVVGQIGYGAQGTTHTVVLGPFSARGVLDSPEKFERATEAGTAARTAGQGLAWDARTGLGKGRFMLAPIFFRPRDAWDFFRGAGPAAEAVAEVVESLPREIGPVCSCGLTAALICRVCGTEYVRHCPLHDRTAQPHRCRRAA
ncbi:hypothetical protein ACIOHE_26535 [Streptomyces sp. NPDC087851]|uniref:hypothetical protein n=1 Tax=Streptomyces sp. NPDC087851 TaxID=3365810 RepID=UPI00381DC3A5